MVGNTPKGIIRLDPPPHEIISALSYRPETGDLTWVIPRNNSAAGIPAGTKSGSGYLQIQYQRRRYAAHRVIWLIVHGVWPSTFIDHVNGDRSDNRLDNLRLATNSQNQANRKPGGRYEKGTSITKVGTFKARIMKDGVSTYLGTFKSEAEAAAAYSTVAAKVHGEFARW